MSTLVSTANSLLSTAYTGGGGNTTHHISNNAIAQNSTNNAIYYRMWSTTATTTYQWPVDYYECEVRDAIDIVKGRLALPKGRALVIELEDGSQIHIDDKGNFQIDDAAAKVIYKANRVREFNTFLNASDLLARFIRDIGTMGVRRNEVATLPLALFVNWLVIEAARSDGDPVPTDVVPVPKHKLLKARVRPRCLVCQRFIKRVLSANQFPFCSQAHAGLHFDRLMVGAG